MYYLGKTIDTWVLTTFTCHLRRFNIGMSIHYTIWHYIFVTLTTSWTSRTLSGLNQLSKCVSAMSKRQKNLNCYNLEPMNSYQEIKLLSEHFVQDMFKCSCAFSSCFYRKERLLSLIWSVKWNSPASHSMRISSLSQSMWSPSGLSLITNNLLHLTNHLSSGYCCV